MGESARTTSEVWFIHTMHELSVALRLVDALDQELAAEDDALVVSTVAIQVGDRRESVGFIFEKNFSGAVSTNLVDLDLWLPIEQQLIRPVSRQVRGKKRRKRSSDDRRDGREIRAGLPWRGRMFGCDEIRFRLT